MFDRVTTRSRGFGFVTFENYVVGQQLVKMGHVPMRQNKFVEIKAAEPKGSPSMYHHPSTAPRYHPAQGRANFGGMIPVVPTTTTTSTTVAIMGETTTATDPSSATAPWISTIPAATTRVPFPPPFYPSPTVMMEHSSMASSIPETTTILHGGGMCLDLPSPPFWTPYPIYPPYASGAYPSPGPTAPPLSSAPLYDVYAPPSEYTAPFDAIGAAPEITPPEEEEEPSVERSS
jgi:hypothetical protein